MKVLVTHPGRQHSHQAALALAATGSLAGYWAGVPALARQGRLVPAPLRSRLARYAPVDLPAERVRWTPWVPALRRLGDRLPGGLAGRADLLACRLFDRWAAGRLAALAAGALGAPDAVLACEISARDTFRRARRLGIATFLDAPALHHRTQDLLYGLPADPNLHRRIAAVKDEEIALADVVLTVSEPARQSYLAAGVPPERVWCLPLGADVALFAPPRAGAAEAGEAREVTLVFAGAASRVKGFDLLLAAFARVRESAPARLWAIGPPGDAAVAPGGAPEGVTVLGPLSQAELAARFHAADCLVLPSRGESFGMVVAEALAAGLPAVVSERAGAAALVRPGVNGWVVPAGDAAALAERLLWCARHGEELRRMRPACRESAAAADWSVYRARLPVLLSEALEGGRARPAARRAGAGR